MCSSDLETPIPYQVDGDYLGEATRLEFRHVPDAVRLVFPGDTSSEPAGAGAGAG